MFSYSEAYFELKARLQKLYEMREAVAIAHEIMEHITGLGKLQRLADKDKRFTDEQDKLFREALSYLLTGMPLQYVLGYAWFMGREYKVNEHVLIPRPETEELVAWVISKVESEKLKPKILDIGTGSGCIPISLKLALPGATVTSCDISPEAIEVAGENAKKLGADILFINADFLNKEGWKEFGKYDVIISNPPYIPIAEKESLHVNVKDFEPAVALFVADDALLFYKAIAAFGKTHLNEKGAIYCELHKDHAIAAKELFERQDYRVELQVDMHGNNRMLKAEALQK